MAEEQVMVEAEEEVETPAKPKKKPSKEKQIQLSLDQYFDQCRPDTHKYTRAYVGSKYRGIIKTIKEWDDELKGKL